MADTERAILHFDCMIARLEGETLEAIKDPTQRFSDRVADYVKYRPEYPNEIVPLLKDLANLSNQSVIADVGSGTGKLTEQLLQIGCNVLAVEPNEEMRAAAQELLDHDPHFTSVVGQAEATTLPDASVDLIAAGQAFHWFDPNKTRLEFMRILRPDGRVALIWNRRRTESCPFLRAYDALLMEHAEEYREGHGNHVEPAVLRQFFGHDSVDTHRFDNVQRFDWPGLKGRVLSASYVPKDGPAHERILAELESLFDAYKDNETVAFTYDTEVYLGPLNDFSEGKWEHV